ncbi:MAG: hypothetical protein R6U01_02830 [Halorubrum sp.]|uniref:hypothetical protein n=1 Tax=Halorubrum sp. TaxID=1879286 RepID=UPI003970A58B
MDEVPDRETAQEWAEEHDIGRRDVLKGILPVIGGVWVFRNQLPTSSNAGSRLSDAEDSATALAERLTVTDNRDPLAMSGLTPMVEKTIETIDEVLHDGTVTKGVWIAEKRRQVADALSILPGVASPPAESRPKTRVARLEAALTYYQSLNEVLQYAASTQRELATIESPALDHGIRPEQTPPSIFDTDEMDTRAEETRKTGERLVDDVSTDSLLPDTEQVAAQLTAQAQIQYQLSTAVQAYLDTGELIQTGARWHEREKLDKAKDQFHAAKEQIPEAVHESDPGFAISHDGPTLHEYRTLFTMRGEGLDQLITACSSEVDANKQATLFNAGLSHLIDARGVIEQ